MNTAIAMPSPPKAPRSPLSHPTNSTKYALASTRSRMEQPRCGDGTNYSFLVSRPEKQQQPSSPSKEKIFIEFSGGGACWDDLTCKLQSSWLTFPSWFNSVVGSSCSELGEMLLCAKTLGDTDFSEYTTVLIPYCTQDVHLGDEPNASYDGGSNIIQHVGAHNMYRTLKWVFDNFPDPSHIFLTGCSAGGTPLPVVYDLINSHYNSGGRGQPSVSVIADSPVFLTPSYFLQNSLPNWNVGTIMKMIGFDFDMYKNEESFPLDLLEYSLERSNKNDKWGFVTHNNDQISLWYYSLMGGSSLGDLFDGGRQLLSPKQDDLGTLNRKLAEEMQSQWWTELNSSMTLAANDHSNFDIFVMEGNGHCGFGLNTPLKYTGFEEWASTIVKEHDAPIMVADGPLESPSNSSLSPTAAGLPSAMIPNTNTIVKENDAPVMVADGPFESPLNSSLSPTAADPPSAMIPNNETMSNVAASQASSSFATTAVVMLTMRFLSSLVH